MADAPTLDAPRGPLGALIAAAFPFAFANLAFATVAPLWAVAEAGGDPAAWAGLRSARAIGSLVGAVAMGVLAQRVGDRRMTTACLLGAGLGVAALARGWSIGLAMPVVGAAVSMAFVGFNSLTQDAGRSLGSANAAYRAAGAIAGIGAPVAAVAGATAFGGYAPVLAATALMLAFAALATCLYRCPALRDDDATLAGAARGYLAALRHRPLLAFITAGEATACALEAMNTFAALRCTLDLGISPAGFSGLAALAGIGGIVLIIACGRLADRAPPLRVLAALAGVGAVCCLAFGAGDSAPLGAVAFAVGTAAITAWTVPLSIAVGERARGIARSRAFAAHKLAQALTTAAGTAALAALEPVVGMRALLIAGGMLGLVGAAVLAAMADDRAPEGLSRRRPA